MLRTPLDPIACSASTYGLHEDRTPSLQLYQDGTWYCYGACHAGGSVFDFASRIWSTGTKRQEIPAAARSTRRRAVAAQASFQDAT